MFHIGDLLIYTGQGICKVDDICDKTYSGITKTYYVLHPIENNHQLTINTPVDNENKIMKLMNKEEAETILESFQLEGVNWIDKPPLRSKVFNEIVSSGNRLDIAKVANTLLKKQRELEMNGKKLYGQDVKILNTIQNIMFKELAIALNTSYKAINEKILIMLHISSH